MNLSVAVPRPELDATVIQSTFDFADQPLPDGAVTFTEKLPPELSKSADSVSITAPTPACVTVCLLPLT